MESSTVTLDTECVTILGRVNYCEVDSKLTFIYLSQNLESVSTKKVCYFYFEFRIVIVC